MRDILKNRYFALTGWLARRSFRFFEKYAGVHVTPANYYSPIPNLSELPDEVFTKVYEGSGVDWNESGQRFCLRNVFPRYRDEFVPQPNRGLTLVDSYVLYAFIREKKPKHFVEIGAGDTTHIALRALDANRAEGIESMMTSIEPYPRADILALDRPGFQLISAPVQSVAPAFFGDVDILFIDSSHVSKLGSDVNHEILEVVPRLKTGALVHWHDIPMPENYWKEWAETGTMFWNEAYVLYAFLLFNDSFSTIWASNYMRVRHWDELVASFPYLTAQHRLSSYWVERVATRSA